MLSRCRLCHKPVTCCATSDSEPCLAGRDRFDWEEQLQGVAMEASQGSEQGQTALSSLAYGDSGDLDDPIQVRVAERQKSGRKGGWFGRGMKDQPKPARPTGAC